MDRLAKFIVTKRKALVVFFALATLVSVVLAPTVVINYDQTAYLPTDMPTRHALNVMAQEFGLHGFAEVIAADIDLPTALQLKREISAVEGVQSVVWLDDAVDVNMPLPMLPQATVREFYAGGSARFHVTFVAGDHDLATGQAVQLLRQLHGGDVLVRGPAPEALNLRGTTTTEISTIIAFVLPIFLLILFLATSSWLEPLLFIFTIGISIVLNMGTNAFLGSISFITFATAGLLQFAVSMDYSIFLLHRFTEERQKGLDIEQAMVAALRHSFASILASSLTTIAGFVALMFMRYSLGYDLGLVLAKGVALSLLSVLTLLPALVIFLARFIERTQHRSLLPPLQGVARGIVGMRWIVPVVLLLLPIAFVAQGANHFLYGEAAPTEASMPHPYFGRSNPLVLLVPANDVLKEHSLVNALREIPHVRSVTGLASVVDISVPRSILPPAVVAQFVGENYTRITMMLDTPVESVASYRAVSNIRQAAEAHYPGAAMLLGASPAVDDIRAVVEYDFAVTSLIAILAVGAIIALTFRSLSLPLFLVLTIQASIWINMAIPYFTGSPLIFIGYMIVSAVQLGATIDYAILLTGRYLEFRRSMTVRQAAVAAIESSGYSVLTSAAILASAGFTLGFVSGVPSIAALGMLIGRGALLSCLLVLTFLPQLLMYGDRFIRMTTLTKPMDQVL